MNALRQCIEILLREQQAREDLIQRLIQLEQGNENGHAAPTAKTKPKASVLNIPRIRKGGPIEKIYAYLVKHGSGTYADFCRAGVKPSTIFGATKRLATHGKIRITGDGTGHKHVYEVI